MTRLQALAAAAIAVLVVLTVIVAQRYVGDDTTAKPTDRDIDISRRVTELNEPGNEQAKQYQRAIEELREETASRQHEIVVTVRDEPPLDIWKVDGHACTIVNDQITSAVNITQPTLDGSSFEIVQQAVPTTAKLLRSGACEATTGYRVRDAATYDLHLWLSGGDISNQTKLKHHGTSQKVTLVH